MNFYEKHTLSDSSSNDHWLVTRRICIQRNRPYSPSDCAGHHQPFAGRDQKSVMKYNHTSINSQALL
jgi:hypothetical protein